MKRSSQFLVSIILLLVFAGSARAGITVTLNSPQTTYTAGQDNTFTFNVGLVYTGAEWVDRYQFVFPAGVPVVSATPISGTGGCATNQGIQSICSPSISWHRTGVPCSGPFAPTGCGAYTQSASVFDITVSIPADFNGPLDVTLNSIGDGFLLPAGSVDTDIVTFAIYQAPVSIPTLNEWGLICLSLLMIGAGYIAIQRRMNVAA